MLKIAVICCLILLADVDAFVRREAPQPNLLSDMQKNLDQFRSCVDQSLAGVVGKVNENQLQPLFSAVGDTINRFSKAFDELTANTKPVLTS